MRTSFVLSVLLIGCCSTADAEAKLSALETADLLNFDGVTDPDSRVLIRSAVRELIQAELDYKSIEERDLTDKQRADAVEFVQSGRLVWARNSIEHAEQASERSAFEPYRELWNWLAAAVTARRSLTSSEYRRFRDAGFESKFCDYAWDRWGSP
ncbi:MAG: hypothetical protein ACYS0E_05735 [Planctomycetota bacterium]|jgi:ribosomal protein S12 methylthiotransferase accessory factor YcaO